MSNFFTTLQKYFYTRKYFLEKINNLENEVSSLKDVQETRETTSRFTKETIRASKIFSDFTHIYETLLLDKGSIENVKVGDIVLMYNDEAIGQILKVSSNSSLVELFSKNNEKLEGLINSLDNSPSEDLRIISTSTISTTSIISTDSTNTQKNKEQIESVLINIEKSETGFIIIDVYGYGGGDFTAKIPNNIEVATGTLVYLANDSGLVLGEIVSIEKKDTSFYKTLYIRGYYNPRQDSVYYIKTN